MEGYDFNIMEALNSPIVPPSALFPEVEEPEAEDESGESVMLCEILKSVTRIEELLRPQQQIQQQPGISPMLDATMF